MKRSRKYIGLILMLLPLGLLAQKDDIYDFKKQLRISSGADELAAVPFEENVVYSSQNTSVGIASSTDQLGRKFFTMFEYVPRTNRKSVFSDQFVSLWHEGIPSFTADFSQVVFCQMDRDAAQGKQVPLKLYFSENLNGMWSRPTEFEHNSDSSLLFSPAFSPGGDTLFFAADYSGGEGGFDLYWCVRDGDSWSEPENLGPGVNTDQHEVYPSFHPMGQLYFSSEGHDGGKDGYDLFETRVVNGKWSKAVKLPVGQRRPRPNSPDNDMHIWYSADMKSGYLTTDSRSSSKDIWAFQTNIPDPPAEIKPIKKTYYKYRIYDRKLDTVDTELFRYSWVINDTLEIPGHDIIYKFPKPGVYECKLNVFDLQLDTLLEGQTVKTLPIRLNVQAVITIPDTVQVGEAVSFDGSQTHLPDVPPDSRAYYWDFGDTYKGIGEIVEHSYGFPGTYRVVLNVDEQLEGRNPGREPKRYANYRDIVVMQPQ